MSGYLNRRRRRVAIHLTIPLRRRQIPGFVFILGLALVVAGCGGGKGGGGSGGGSAAVCIPGASVACACANGASGAQICNASGSGYGACSCSSSGAAGAAGSAGSLGTAGGAGTNGGVGGNGSAGHGPGGGGTAGSGGGGGEVGGSAGTGSGGASTGRTDGGVDGGGVTPLIGSFSCTDFDTSGACVPFDTGTEGKFGNPTSGSTTIAYPLDNSLFPSNLGPVQVQMTTAGASARISFQTTQSGNVSVQFYGTCETASGSGCSVTIPSAFIQMLIPACQTENIQLTASVLGDSGTPTGDSLPISVAWANAALTGGLYYWTILPNQSYCPSSTVVSPGTYCLEDITQTPKNGTAIYRYDFSQPGPAPQQVWTDDGGPDSTPPYEGSPQAWTSGVTGGHCIGCHSITNDGKLMALTIGGSSTYNAANWEVLDIQNQDALLINPTRTGGNGCNDANASPTNDPVCYWEQYRKDGFATETAWGPHDDAMVSMYKSKLYFNTVAVNGTSATIAESGLALPTSATAIDPYQSDPFWSHDGSLLVYTSFNTAAAASTQGNPGGLNGDLKTGGQIAIADATPEAVTDDARVLVPRVSGTTSYYPCVSEDSSYVVFNESDCGGDPTATDINYNGTAGYGTGVCDGYDDSSAKLWWVSASGGAGVRLDNANGGSANYDNSWPRFGPDVGSFRGRKLYWVAFSSRRPYGVQNNTAGLLTSQPQLWFAAVTPGQVNVGDPSFAPVWLPGQNPMGNGNAYGNHVPQWVKVAITLDSP
jgi:hypothetical protein